jgi:Nucleosome assembly protein (NAP)
MTTMKRTKLTRRRALVRSYQRLRIRASRSLSYFPGFLPSSPVIDTEPGSADGIPQFWLTTLRNHSGLSDLITDRDEKALAYLRDVRFEHLDPHSGDKKMGFKLFFEFDENPFFEGTALEKTYHYLVSLVHRESGYSLC